MMICKILLLGCIFSVVQGERKSAIFNAAKITCSELLEQSELPKDLLQCAVHCLDNTDCEAFKHENEVCSLRSELLSCQETQEETEVFLHEKISLKRLKAKQQSGRKHVLHFFANKEIEYDSRCSNDYDNNDNYDDYHNYHLHDCGYRELL